MKLIKAKYEIISNINSEEILKQIEFVSRTCYKSEGLIEYEDYNLEYNPNIVVHNKTDYFAKSARILIPKLISRGHEAMLEFANITIKFTCDRGVSHELVRHRIASFAQESTRYCNYGKDEHISFIIPSWLSIEENIYTWDDTTYLYNYPIQYINTLLDSETRYNALLKEYNWSPQEARIVLPNSLKPEINVSANIREWRHILKLRCSNAAHPDMQALMRPLLNEFKRIIPILFDDINY